MRTIEFHTKFKKDYKRIIKRGYDAQKLKTVIALLEEEKLLPPQYKDYALSGNYAGCRECHIEPDWLLIYQISGDNLILCLMRTGTHSDLF